MKKLTTTALSLLLVSLAGGVYGQPDFEETKLLAEQGDAAAQNNIGFMYDNGVGVPENNAEALKWYRLAADQGSAEAQSNLGVMYFTGEGVPENNAEALKWFRLAAGQGLALAQSNLGVMYAKGEGVPQNSVRAYVWLSVSTAQGFDNARTNRDLISETLTPDQLARGEDMATRCFESDFQDCD